jgi:prolyl-tRNA synthetase family II
MRLSRYFLPILKETPKEAEIVSHRLMLRAGMIRQEAAGSYAWLPLGVRVLHKICAIVREEQDRAGAIEVLMPTIQSADLWRESGRYDDYGKEMLRIRDRHDRDMLYGPTNEEMITEIFRASVRSYKDLPLNLYHIQWKFRDEVRPRFGVMRSREFLMKDAYAFDLDQTGARHSYNREFTAYLRTFARLGLTAIPMRAESGRSAATSATSSSFWRRPARVRCFAIATTSRSRRRPRTSTSAASRRCRGSSTSGPRSTPPRPTNTMRLRSSDSIPRTRFPRAGSRSAIFSTSEPSTRLP